MNTRLIIAVVICSGIIAYGALAIVKHLHNEIANAEDQIASMKPYKPAPYRRLQINHTVILFNGDIENARIDDGQFKVENTSNGDTVFPPTRGIAFCVAQSGYFLTALHCVDGGQDIFLIPRNSKYQSNDIEQCRAQIIWRSPKENDLALLHAPALEMPPMRLANELPKAGTRVFSLGYRIAAGKVINVQPPKYPAPATDTTAPLFSCVRNNTPILKGDSGSPLINNEGEVLGVNVSLQAQAANLLEVFKLRGDIPTSTATSLLEDELTTILDNFTANSQSSQQNENKRL